MIYHYRCSDRANCGARKTLKRLIETYVRPPKCPGCHKHKLMLDPSVKRQRKKWDTCCCGGYPFPHRKGSFWCVHNTINPPQEGDVHPIYEGAG